MNRQEVYDLLTWDRINNKGNISDWNRLRRLHEWLPDLSGLWLRDSYLVDVDFSHLNMENSDFTKSQLMNANLCGANLAGTDFTDTKLTGANLVGANLSGAILADANLTAADLSGSNLRGANISGTIFYKTKLANATFALARCGQTIFSALDLSETRDLELLNHTGPSSVDTDTFSQSKGRIPEKFLRGCGLTSWQVLSVNFYDPWLTPPQFVEIQYQGFSAWAKGRGMINGCFISYSWKDSKFVDKLCDRLINEGINVWLDRHDMLPGTIQDQVWKAIQIHHVVILVLSEASTQSDWVENELDMARRKERDEGRAVLCPVALDDAWKEKLSVGGGPGDENRKLWRTLETKLVMDFSNWKTKAFEGQFEKLVLGLRVNYGP